MAEGQKLLRSSCESVSICGCLFVTDGSVAILEHALIHPWSCWFVLLVLPLLFGLVWIELAFSGCCQEVTTVFRKEPPAVAAAD